MAKEIAKHLCRLFHFLLGMSQSSGSLPTGTLHRNWDEGVQITTLQTSVDADFDIVKMQSTNRKIPPLLW